MTGSDQTMRYIFGKHDHAFQIKTIREGIEQYRNAASSEPDAFEMHPVYDDILGQLADHLLGHWKDQVTVLALGGYGRKEMSPYSDIDLLFLTEQIHSEGVYTGIRNILRLLWDAKVELGHSVRTVEECKIEANKDLAVLTSLMDVRHVWGSQDLFRELVRERERVISEANHLDLYLRVEGEIRRTCSEFTQTIYLLEPYVKEGPGSLRYMQLIGWLARMIFGCSSLDDLPLLGLASPQAVQEAKKGVKFLAGVRTRLHFLAGRRDDRLRFDAQSVLARQLGFQDAANRLGVERFMREYYRYAATNDFFGQRVLARARLFLVPKGTPHAKRMKLDESFYIGAGGINRYDWENPSLDPGETARAFLWIARTGCHLDIRLMDAIRTYLRSTEDRWAEDPVVNATFLEIFRTRGPLAKALTAMMQSGFLERFIVEFERVRYLRLYDAYHQFTVDVHCMAVLENIDDFGRTDGEAGEVLSRTIFARLEKPEILYLAALFHDIGKGGGPGHELRGVTIARPVLERLNLPPEDIDDVCFLIRNHLAMTHMAFRKDIHDDALLSRFAETLMHQRMLDMLMLLTEADLKAIGPRGFSSWRGHLLEELYYRTLDIFEGESAQGEDLGEWLHQIKTVVKESVPQEKRGPELDRFLAGAPPRYLLDFYPGVIADHFLAVRSYMERHGKQSLDLDDIITNKVDHRRPGYSAITLITHDRHGLFFRMAGTLSANRINILSAWSHTIEADVVVATFHVNDIPHGPLDDPQRWEKFQRDIEGVMRGEIDVDELMATRRGSARFPPGMFSPRITLKVEVDNATSDRATIVEVYAPDRSGLLYDITRYLSFLGLDIVLTKIITEGEQAADVFYVVDEQGQKIVDFDRLDHIRTSLREHLARIEESLAADRTSGTAA